MLLTTCCARRMLMTSVRKSTHFARRSEFNNKCCFKADSSIRCKTTPTRMPSDTTSPQACSYNDNSRSKASNRAITSPEKSKFRMPNKMPANLVLTLGSKRRQSDRQAPAPSAGPALTTWSSAALRHTITKMKASCSLACRSPSVESTAFTTGSSVISAFVISNASSPLHAAVYEVMTTFQSRHFAPDPSKESGLPSPRVSTNEARCAGAEAAACDTEACNVALFWRCCTNSPSRAAMRCIIWLKASSMAY